MNEKSEFAEIKLSGNEFQADIVESKNGWTKAWNPNWGLRNLTEQAERPCLNVDSKRSLIVLA